MERIHKDCNGNVLEVEMKVLSIGGSHTGKVGWVTGDAWSVHGVMVRFEGRIHPTFKIAKRLKIVDPDLELAEGL